jgi:hypothetical protein
LLAHGEPTKTAELGSSARTPWLPKKGALTGTRFVCFDLPGEFELEIPMLEQAVRARVIWSKAGNHGVTFLDALREPAGDAALDLLEKLQSSDHSS